MLFRLLTLLLLAFAVLWPRSAEARLSPKLERKVADSAALLGELVTMRDAEIPRDLLSDATCIVVIPDLTKGALGVGGRYGKGLASCRNEAGEWGAPAFIEVGGASIGFQIGGERIDLMLIVRGRESAKWLLRDKFTLGADASVAAGPYGRTAGAATDAALRAAILSYSRTRGAFAGVSIDGAVLKQDKSDNRRLYGRPVTARRVLLPDEGEALAIPQAARPFIDALHEHAPAPEK